MSNIIDDFGCAFDKVKNFVQDHPGEALMIAAMPVAGTAVLAGTLAAEAAAQKVLPAITIAEGAALGAGVLAAAGGIMAGMEPVPSLILGPIAAKAAEGALKGAAEALKHAGHADKSPCPEK